MAEKPTTKKPKRASAKLRAKRKARPAGPCAGNGTPPGKATTPQPHGGAIGNPAFQPTDAQRQTVRTLAKAFPVHGEHLIARMAGFSRDTLRKYFAEDMEQGRAEMLAGVASQLISRALDEDKVGPDGKKIARGNLDAQKFILARMGGWTTKVDVGEQAKLPYGGSVDLSRLSDEQLAEYGRLAAIAEGLDPEGLIGESDE